MKQQFLHCCGAQPRSVVHLLTDLIAGAALAFGTALSKALGDRKGIHRFGNFSAPLDEALVDCVLVGPVLGSYDLCVTCVSFALLCI